MRQIDMKIVIDGIRLGPYPRLCSKSIDEMVNDAFDGSLFSDDVSIAVFMKRKVGHFNVSIVFSGFGSVNIEKLIDYVSNTFLSDKIEVKMMLSPDIE